MVVYLITNKINGKQYVGQTTKTLEERWKQHCKVTRGNCHALASAIRKYGAENFTQRVLSKCSDPHQLNEAEVHFIDYFQTLSPNGYNLTTGGNAKKRVSSETREKLSKAHLGKSRAPYTAVTRRKISESKLGKPRSEETRRKMSLGKMGSIPWNKGIPATLETKEKMALARQGRKLSPAHKEAISKAMTVVRAKKGASWAA